MDLVGTNGPRRSQRPVLSTVNPSPEKCQSKIEGRTLSHLVEIPDMGLRMQVFCGQVEQYILDVLRLEVDVEVVGGQYTECPSYVERSILLAGIGQQVKL